MISSQRFMSTHRVSNKLLTISLLIVNEQLKRTMLLRTGGSERQRANDRMNLMGKKMSWTEESLKIVVKWALKNKIR